MTRITVTCLKLSTLRQSRVHLYKKLLNPTLNLLLHSQEDAETEDSITFTSAEYNAASFCVGLVELRSSYVSDCLNIHETTIEYIKYIARHQYCGACAKRPGQLYLLNMLQKHFYVG